MRKHINVDWVLPDKVEWVQAQTAVLMDIRAELKALNAFLHCPNAIAIPRILRAIRRNTFRKRKPHKPHSKGKRR